MAVLRRGHPSKEVLLRRLHLTQFNTVDDIYSLLFASSLKKPLEPVDIDALLDLIGIEIVIDNTVPYAGKAIKINDTWHFIMAKNERMVKTRLLMFYIFVRNDVKKTIILEHGLKKEDLENPDLRIINKTAIELLIPEYEFKHYIDYCSNNITDVAKHFKVPELTVKLYAKRIGYEVIFNV